MQTRRDNTTKKTGGLSLYVAGAVLVLSGVAHIIVWLASGESLAGPVSFRKPILFGLSAGVTAISLGWVLTKLQRRRGDSLLATLTAAALVGEVALITIQQWRGVPSHFNSATPLDATILAWIGWLIFFVTLVIADLTIRSFRRVNASPDVAWAMRSGMSWLLLSCLLGFVLVAHGEAQIARGEPPEVYGEAGVMKFPHGIPMHAIQFLPVLAWGLRRLGCSVEERRLAVISASAGVFLATLFGAMQTFGGRARFDLTPLSAIVLAATLTTIAAAIFPAIRALRAPRLMIS